MAVVGVGVAVVGVAFDHEKRLLLSKTLSRETLSGPDVRLFVLADEQRETGRDVRPVLGVRNIICFDPGKLCFPLREIFSVTQNNLPARGRKAPPKSSLFTGHPMCRDRILTAEGFPAPFVQKWGPWKA